MDQGLFMRELAAEGVHSNRDFACLISAGWAPDDSALSLSGKCQVQGWVNKIKQRLEDDEGFKKLLEDERAKIAPRPA